MLLIGIYSLYQWYNILCLYVRLQLSGNETNILVVAMHHSETEQWNDVNKDSRDLDHPSRFPLIKIFYCKPLIDNKEVNKQATEDIEKFLLAK